MKNYIIRFFLDNLTIVEYNITAGSMIAAEDEALRKLKESGIPGRIQYLTTQGTV